MKGGMFALASVIALCGFLVLGSMMMAGAVTDLNPDSVQPEYDTTAGLMQTFFSVFQEWNFILVLILGVIGLVVGLWYLLQFKK